MPKKTAITLVVFGLLAWAMYTIYPREQFDPVADARFAIQDQIWNELGRGSEVDCDDPPEATVGTMFVCRAAVSGGTTFTFEVSIVEGPAVTTALDIVN